MWSFPRRIYVPLLRKLTKNIALGNWCLVQSTFLLEMRGSPTVEVWKIKIPLQRCFSGFMLVFPRSNLSWTTRFVRSFLVHKPFWVGWVLDKLSRQLSSYATWRANPNGVRGSTLVETRRMPTRIKQTWTAHPWNGLQHYPELHWPNQIDT